MEEAKSAFDDENFGPVVLIQLMRLYDLQLAFLSAINPAKAEQIRDLHERGQTFCPPPMFVEYEENNERDNDVSSLRAEDEQEPTS